jgi:hypothetical protein
MPFRHVENDPKSALARKYSDYGAAFRDYPQEGLYGIPFFPVGAFIHPPLFVEIPMKLVCLGPFAITLVKDRSIKGILRAI